MGWYPTVVLPSVDEKPFTEVDFLQLIHLGLSFHRFIPHYLVSNYCTESISVIDCMHN